MLPLLSLFVTFCVFCGYSLLRSHSGGESADGGGRRIVLLPAAGLDLVLEHLTHALANDAVGQPWEEATDEHQELALECQRRLVGTSLDRFERCQGRFLGGHAAEMIE